MPIVVEPLGVAPDLEPGRVGVEDAGELLDVGRRGRVDLLLREPGPGGRAARRVADPGGEVAEDQHGDVAGVLEPAQRPQHDRVAEVEVGGGRVETELHPQAAAGGELGGAAHPGVITSTAPCVSGPARGFGRRRRADMRSRLARPRPPVAGERQWCRCDSCDCVAHRLSRPRLPGVVVALAVALGARRRRPAATPPNLDRLTSAVPDQSSVVLAADGTRARPPRRRRAPHRRRAWRKIAQPLQHAVVAIEDHRFYEHSGRRHPRDRARAAHRPRHRRDRAGRLDDHPAVRAQRDARRPPDRAPQAARDHARGPTRAQVHEGPDPRALPQPRLLRQRRVRRRRARRWRYFGKSREHADAGPERAARRPDPGARGLQPVRRTRRSRSTGATSCSTRWRSTASRRRPPSPTAEAQPLGLHPGADDNRMRAAVLRRPGRALRALARRVRQDRRRAPPPALHRRARHPHDARSGAASSWPNRPSTTCSSTRRTTRAGSLVSIEPEERRTSSRTSAATTSTASAPYAQFDLASQGQRQAGSAFKPFVLAAALDRARPPRPHLPGTRGADDRRRPGKPPWVLHNYDGKGGGTMNLVDATVHSVNTVYAQLIQDVGPKRVVELASQLGITSQLAPYLSTAIGSNAVSVLDMASAYTSFAADGSAHRSGVRHQGRRAPTARCSTTRPPTSHRVLPASIAREVNEVLQQVVTRGTGVNARIGRPVAGKTGTGEDWQRRVVRRLDPAADDRGVGRLPADGAVDGSAADAREGHRRHVARADLGAVTRVPRSRRRRSRTSPTPSAGAATAALPSPPIANVVGMPVDEAEKVLTDTGLQGRAAC